MITYEKDKEGDLVMMVDDETITGTFIKLGLGDDRGLEMMLRFADFYEEKGHNVRRIIGNYFEQKEGNRLLPRQGWTWAKLFSFLRGK